jgi:RNA 2',3'-cyclic 3'-phosphodiesterase
VALGDKLIRAFFAAEIDDDLRRELAKIMADLDGVGAQVRWVRPQNLHWTVKFLGDVPWLETGAIADAAREACAAHQPFEGRVAGVGSFPPGKRIRTVAARLEDGGGMGAVRDALEPSLEGFGVPPDGRGFKAHLTIGRVKGGQRVLELTEALKPYAEMDLGECYIDELTLFQSELSRSGPVYTPLAHIPLGDG